MFGCLFFLVFTLLLCVFCNILNVFYLFTNFNDCNSLSSYVYVQAHVNIGKDYLQSNNNVSSKDSWFLFSASTLFLKAWFNKIGNIKLRLNGCLIVYLLFFSHMHTKTSNH